VMLDELVCFGPVTLDSDSQREYAERPAYRGLRN
jgi:hypothetical protein